MLLLSAVRALFWTIGFIIGKSVSTFVSPSADALVAFFVITAVLFADQAVSEWLLELFDK